MKVKRSSRFLAAVLVMVLMITALPTSVMSDYVSIEADAATNGVVTRINSLRGIFKTKSGGKYYFTTDGKAHGGNTCKECYLPNVIKQNPDIKAAKLNIPATRKGYSCWGFTNFAFYYIFGYYPSISNSYSAMKKEISLTIDTKNSSKRVGELSKIFEEKVKPGDILCYHYPNYTGFRADAHHFVIYTGMSKDKKSIYYMDSNNPGKNQLNLNNSRSIAGYYTKGTYSIDKIYVYHAKNYGSIAPTTLASVSSSGASNTSVKLTGNLTSYDVVDGWGYYLSENQKDVSSVNGTNAGSHKSTSTMDYVRFFKGNENEKSRTVTVSKFQGQPLKSGTTYYYKLVVSVGGVISQSKVSSFTTARIEPGAAVLKVGKGSDAVGIGEQVTLLWDAASLADSYNITVTDANGAAVQTKNDVKGVTCVLDGISKAGLYTASITSVNAAGTTEGTGVQFSVTPDREIVYVDTFDQPEAIVDTQHVRPGAAPAEPKGPEHEGHTFSKWTLVSTTGAESDTPDYEKVVKERYEAVYDKNSYTVNFIDSFTNKILKTQTVRYKESAHAPTVTVPEGKEGYVFDRWDNDVTSITKDIDIHTVYKWADADHAATIDEKTVFVKRIDAQLNTDTKLGYEIECTITNHIAEVLSGRLVAVLKTKNDTILTSVESSAFAIDSAAMDGTSRTIKMTVLYAGLADKIELYVINDYESLGKLCATISKDIDNRNGFSEWTAYEGECPMKGSNVETTEITESTPEKKYYRYRLKEETTSTATSMSGYTQDGYTAQKASSGYVDYVKSWHSGFDTSNAYYKKYNNTPKTAGETATQITKIDSSSTTGYLYWHWCRGSHLGTPCNRCIEYSKTSTYSKFHCFASTKNPSSLTYTDGAYKYSAASECDDTYWWGYTPVIRQNYTIYNKVYNYYKLSDYTDWIEYEGDVPVAENSLLDGKKIVELETKVEPASSVTTKYYRYSTENPTVEEPVPAEGQVVSISGSVGEAYKGKPVTVWVYKYAQASDYTTEFAATTTVADDGTVSIEKAFLREAPTIESGDYRIVASVEGQARAAELGVIKAPKAVYTVKFYGFASANEPAQVISEQQIEEGGNAVTPKREDINVPEGYRFTNWSQSVINVRSNMDVYPESEIETYTVAFVNWENQTVSMKNFLYGSELVADDAPEGKEGFVTEWIIRTADDKEQTLDDYTKAGGRVNGNMIVVTRSYEQTYDVKFIGAKFDAMLTQSVAEEDIETVFREEEASGDHKTLEIVDEQKIKFGDNISFEKVQPEVEESQDIIFLGWINAYTGLSVDETTVKEPMLLYPTYIFPETAAEPVIDVESGEYTTEQTITVTTESEKAVVWYTTDGSDPRTSETAVEYVAPVKLNKSAMFICYASEMGKNDSSLATSVYAVNTGDSAAYHIVDIDYSSVTITNADPIENAVYLVKEGSKLKGIELVEVEGNAVDGLYFDKSYTEFFDVDEEVVSETMTLYAHYTPNTYKVDFVYIDADGNEQTIDSQNVKYTESATEPTAPEIEGKIFAGWSTSFEMISADTKVMARYIDKDEYAAVKLSRTKAISLAVGNSYSKLKAIIEPDYDYEVVWTSDDSEVAEVDENGVINAVKAGTATITATLPYTGASASVKVNVTADLDTTITCKNSADISLDSAGNVRNVRAGSNTVDEVLDKFLNDGLVVVNAQGEKLSGTDKVGTGASVCLYDGDTLIASAKVAVVGDYDGDGAVTARDVVMMNQHAVGKRDINDIQSIAVDVNGDGFVNNKDCSAVSRYLVGKALI